MAVQSPPFVAQSASHSAALFRQAGGATFWQGGPTDGASYVVAAQSTPNMTVQVAAGQAWIDGTQVALASGQIFSTQGSYYALNDAPVTLTITTAHPTLPRIDIVCLSINDAQYSGAVNTAVLSVVAGTPAGSPVAPAAPANSAILARITVAGAATSIINANITIANTTAGGQLPAVAVVNGTPIPFNSTSRPTGLRIGALGYEIDTNRLLMFTAFGWLPYGWGSLSATSTTRPATAITGQVIYETDTRRMMVYTGSVWSSPGHIEDAAWTNVSTFLNGWSNYGSGYTGARYRKLTTGQVEIQGLVKNPAGASFNAIFTLPVGYRPGVTAGTQLLFPATADNAVPTNVVSELRVDGNGQVSAWTGGGQTYFSINCVFYAEQ